MEVVGVHAEQARGTRMALSGPLEGTDDELSLRLLERGVIVERRRCRCEGVAKTGRQIVGQDVFARAECQRLLDDVFELTDVTRPVVLLEARERGRCDLADAPAAPRRMLSDEVFGKQREIVLAFA